ncbi:MAG: lantibiotic dehydratase [Sphingobacteriales bacterium]
MNDTITRYEFLNEIILRSPVFSIKHYKPENIGDILHDPYFQTALYLASPQLYQAAEKKGFEFTGLSGKEQLSLLKYYNRMSFRPTPFGSFASFTLLGWGTHDQIKLEPLEACKLHLRLDQQVVLELARALTQDEKAGVYQVNATLYQAGKSFRFIRTDYSDEHGKADFDLESYECNALTAELINFCKQTSRKWEEISSRMMTLSGCEEETAVDYLHFLIGAQILVPCSAINIIGDDYLGRLLDEGGLPETLLKKQLAALYRRMLQVSFPNLKHLDLLNRRLSSYGVKGSGQLYYAGLERSAASGGLHTKYQQQVREGLTALTVLSPHMQPAMLQQFISDFKARYDRRKIPLLEALDPETGIGYGPLLSPAGDQALLRDVNFSAQENPNALLEWSPVHRLLLERWTANEPIILTEADLAGLPIDHSLLPPPTLAVLFRIVDDGVFLETAGGTTATALIGRFSAWSPDVHNICRRLADLEQSANPGAVFADIGQLSDTHADNINRRQPCFDYEIPVNAVSLLPAEKQIRLSDLRVSVRGDALILESASLEKRVIPRLSSAYNYTRNQLAVFRLLCDLQYQGIKASYALDMEQHFPGLSFYPRVVFKNTILCPAVWHLSAEQLSAQDFTVLREKLGLPACVALSRHDQQLIFNLEKEEEAAFFLDCIKGMKNITLQEFLVNSREPGVNQFVSFLHHKEPVYQAKLPEEQLQRRNIRPDFMLGSQWIYLKLYCSPAAANELLINNLYPLLKQLDDQVLLAWFFIRYRDPDHHIRLRIKTKEGSVGYVLTRLKKRFAHTVHFHLVREYQADTYRRELERYGADMIRLVEEFFHRSSILTLQYINLTGRRSFPYGYHSLAFVSAAYLLDAFIPDIEARLGFAERMVHTFYNEFSGDKTLKVGLDQKYRELKINIADWLNDKQYFERLKIGDPAKDFHSSVQAIVHAGQNFTVQRKEQLLADLVHMHLNRLFTDRQRNQELIVYYCLYKHQLAVKARVKRG